MTIPEYTPYTSGAKTNPTPGEGKQSAPSSSLYEKNKFPVGGDAIDYYTKSGEKDKIFIPEAMLERLTLLSPRSAAALMDKLA